MDGEDYETFPTTPSPQMSGLLGSGSLDDEEEDDLNNYFNLIQNGEEPSQQEEDESSYTNNSAASYYSSASSYTSYDDPNNVDNSQSSYSEEEDIDNFDKHDDGANDNQEESAASSSAEDSYDSYSDDNQSKKSNLEKDDDDDEYTSASGSAADDDDHSGSSAYDVRYSDHGNMPKKKSSSNKDQDDSFDSGSDSYDDDGDDGNDSSYSSGSHSSHSSEYEEEDEEDLSYGSSRGSDEYSSSNGESFGADDDEGDETKDVTVTKESKPDIPLHNKALEERTMHEGTISERNENDSQSKRDCDNDNTSTQPPSQQDDDTGSQSETKELSGYTKSNTLARESKEEGRFIEPGRDDASINGDEELKHEEQKVEEDGSDLFIEPLKDHTDQDNDKDNHHDEDASSSEDDDNDDIRKSMHSISTSDSERNSVSSSITSTNVSEGSGSYDSSSSNSLKDNDKNDDDSYWDKDNDSTSINKNVDDKDADNESNAVDKKASQSKSPKENKEKDLDESRPSPIPVSVSNGANGLDSSTSTQNDTRDHDRNSNDDNKSTDHEFESSASHVSGDDNDYATSNSFHQRQEEKEGDENTSNGIDIHDEIGQPHLPQHDDSALSKSPQEEDDDAQRVNAVTSTISTSVQHDDHEDSDDGIKETKPQEAQNSEAENDELNQMISSLMKGETIDGKRLQQLEKDTGVNDKEGNESIKTNQEEGVKEEAPAGTIQSEAEEREELNNLISSLLKSNKRDGEKLYNLESQTQMSDQDPKDVDERIQKEKESSGKPSSVLTNASMDGPDDTNAKKNKPREKVAVHHDIDSEEHGENDISSHRASIDSGAESNTHQDISSNTGELSLGMEQAINRATSPSIHPGGEAQAPTDNTPIEFQQEPEQIDEEEARELDELNNLIDCLVKGEKIDEDRLYELELRTRVRNGEALTEQEEADLKMFRSREAEADLESHVDPVAADDSNQSATLETEHTVKSGQAHVSQDCANNESTQYHDTELGVKKHDVSALSVLEKATSNQGDVAFYDNVDIEQQEKKEEDDTVTPELPPEKNHEDEEKIAPRILQIEKKDDSTEVIAEKESPMLLISADDDNLDDSLKLDISCASVNDTTNIIREEHADFRNSIHPLQTNEEARQKVVEAVAARAAAEEKVGRLAGELELARTAKEEKAIARAILKQKNLAEQEQRSKAGVWGRILFRQSSSSDDAPDASDENAEEEDADEVIFLTKEKAYQEAEYELELRQEDEEKAKLVLKAVEAKKKSQMQKESKHQGQEANRANGENDRNETENAGLGSESISVDELNAGRMGECVNQPEYQVAHSAEDQSHDAEEKAVVNKATPGEDGDSFSDDSYSSHADDKSYGDNSETGSDGSYDGSYSDRSEDDSYSDGSYDNSYSDYSKQDIHGGKESKLDNKDQPYSSDGSDTGSKSSNSDYSSDSSQDEKENKVGPDDKLGSPEASNSGLKTSSEGEQRQISDPVVLKTVKQQEVDDQVEDEPGNDSESQPSSKFSWGVGNNNSDDESSESDSYSEWSKELSRESKPSAQPQSEKENSEEVLVVETVTFESDTPIDRFDDEPGYHSAPGSDSSGENRDGSDSYTDDDDNNDRSASDEDILGSASGRRLESGSSFSSDTQVAEANFGKTARKPPATKASKFSGSKTSETEEESYDGDRPRYSSKYKSNFSKWKSMESVANSHSKTAEWPEEPAGSSPSGSDVDPSDSLPDDEDLEAGRPKNEIRSAKWRDKRVIAAVSCVCLLLIIIIVVVVIVASGEEDPEPIQQLQTSPPSLFSTPPSPSPKSILPTSFPVSTLSPTVSTMVVPEFIIFPDADTYIGGNITSLPFGNEDSLIIGEEFVSADDEGVESSFGLISFNISEILEQNKGQQQRATLRLMHVEIDIDRSPSTLIVSRLGSTTVAIESVNNFIPTVEVEGTSFTVKPSDTVVEVDITGLLFAETRSLRSSSRMAQSEQLLLLIENRGPVLEIGDAFRSRESAFSPQLIVEVVVATTDPPSEPTVRTPQPSHVTTIEPSPAVESSFSSLPTIDLTRPNNTTAPSTIPLSMTPTVQDQLSFPPSSFPSLSPTFSLTLSASPTTIAQTNLPLTIVGDFELLEEVPHDARSFTQGLELFPASDFLYYESLGLYGQGAVRIVNLNTGEALQEQLIDEELFGFGLTRYNTEILQLTWKAGYGFIYDSITLRELGTFPINTTKGEGWGICHDTTVNTERLFVSDGTTYLHTWDATSKELVSKVQVTRRTDRTTTEVSTVRRINELEWDRHTNTILANVWQTDLIVRIDPETGFVTHQYDFEVLARPDDADVFNGIAMTDTPNEIWVTGKLWPNMYRVRLL